MRTLGADKVIDYTKEDFATSGQTWDVILDASGTVLFSRTEGSMKQGGSLLVVAGSFARALRMQRLPKASGKKVISAVASCVDGLRFLDELTKAGVLRR